jgi:DNA-binding MarR family transcriptional regulator
MGVIEQPLATPRDADGPLAANLGWLLATAAHVLTTELTAGLERLGLSPRAYCVLATALTGEQTQTELAQRIGIDKTTMVVTLDELESGGLAERKPSKVDRRARVIGVTAAGRRKVAQAERIVDGIHDDVLATLPAKQREQFLAALTTLVCDRLSKPVQCAQPVRRRAPRG